ncbi:hypothetical protein J4W10_21660, partial [Escherichia coli]
PLQRGHRQSVRFNSVLPLHAIVAFLLRIRSLNLLYISRKHFSAPNLMVNMRFSPFLLRVGELIV